MKESREGEGYLVSGVGRCSGVSELEEARRLREETNGRIVNAACTRWLISRGINPHVSYKLLYSLSSNLD